ncbi:SprB repeat-containing protein [Maribacter litopenaei]|uniref:SprB repeat-containing protein n=1 Tax=Maribacter litopenaei TaxID=2976127 RepID=A0ABY5Y7I2_9FLAO|nr:SprB repeat-containing protein [Maribacter litopenaei]UWX54987.1 SprB repeat-containing protein [Maribacter litopenaei]
MYAVVADGVTPTSGDFAITNPVTISSPGDYDVYVRDNNGNAGYCEASFDITVLQDTPMGISVSNTPILCSGDNQATITITASGGEAPYTYSIDNGTTYQISNTFNNLGAGNYNIRVRDANNCEANQTYSITEPFTLSASAAVTQLVECNPSDGAEVRITNAQGGTAPYTYSFDGGLTYGANAIGYLLAGTHTLYIQDANGCTYPMTVTIEQAPTPPNVTLTPTVDYSCDGTGIVTISPDDASLDYTYSINGTPNTPADSNVFTNVPIGTHTISVDYISNAAPTPSTLLLESFGTGVNTSITQIDPAYCYEPQDGTVRACDPGVPNRINDGEYSVTQVISSPFGTWLSPNDHSGDINGRFPAINVGGVAGVGGIIYAKRGIEVIPNRDISVSLWAFNLLRSGTSAVTRPSKSN